MTLAAGAVCSDGVVIIADRKHTDIDPSSSPTFEDKIYGDLKNVIMTFSGSSKYFNMFRKNVAGDVMFLRDDAARYTDENVIPKLCDHMRSFNGFLGYTGGENLEILVARIYPFTKDSELYFIDHEGNSKVIRLHWCLGSGKSLFMKKMGDLDTTKITMKEFAKRVTPIIRLAESPSYDYLGIGLGGQNAPVRYLPNKGPRDIKPPDTDFDEFNSFSNQKLIEWKRK